MNAPDTRRSRSLDDVLEQVLELLDKQDLVARLEERQDTPRHDILQTLLARQQMVELERRLQQLHPADLAFVLEGLPADRRETVWYLIPPEHRGAVLLELAEAVRENLIGKIGRRDLIDAAEHLDSEEIAELAPSLPRDLVVELLGTLTGDDRSEVQRVLSFPEGTVGSLMDLDTLSVRDDVTLEVVLRYLRKRKDDFPEQTDQLCVVDRDGSLRGLLSLRALLTHDPDVRVAAVMTSDPLAFHTDERVSDAAQAFERYDLISAPVINLHGQLVGMLRIEQVMDFVNEQAQSEQLRKAGLTEDEDLFGPVWRSGRNRWLWLALNLVTGFIASRVIGLFEDTIAHIVALATLMPIVASVAGNSGNQTIALVIRGLALRQISTRNVWRLLAKEIGIAGVNGALWGMVVGLFALIFYSNWTLALVMAGALMLNLLIGALAGVLFPLMMKWLGRDPVMGSSVLLTAITDSMGFFIFLGLATMFLR